MSSQPQAHSPARGQRAPNPIEVLHQTLSAKHTEAPAADRHPHIGPLQPAPAGLLRVIGRGTCGTVYTSANPSTVAYKVGRDRDALWNDIQLTARVHDSIRDANVLLLPRVPAIKGWRDKIEHASSFEGGIHAGSHLFGLSFIPTLSREARQALLSQYELTTLQAEAFANPENDFCLIRPYLGLASRIDEPLCRADNLWNFPLTLGDFRGLDMMFDVHLMARGMAGGLATIHWHAGIDGMDIEFVLGGTDGWNDEQVEPASTNDHEPFHTPSLGDLALDIQPTQARRLWQKQLYVLDFDKASRLSFDRPDSAIQRLVTAVTCNDPYFPDPAAENEGDRELWETFRSVYLEAANLVSTGLVQKHGEQARSWPRSFLQEWEEKAKELAEVRDRSFVEFGY
jgi:hypothetical protein